MFFVGTRVICGTKLHKPTKCVRNRNGGNENHKIHI